MDLHLYDSYQRRLRRFTPLDGDRVGMYACGPTVYDYAHIGNLRTYLFEDTLRRALEFGGYRVNHVMNITDVGHLTSDADSGEDKVEQGAKRRGVSAWEIARRFSRAFADDLTRLNILEPSIWCRATEHIAEQIRDIVEIERRGYAYLTTDGVYFDTAKLDGYGHLARLDAAGLAAGARVAVGEKRSATDFALWKFSRAGEARQMEWDSPWGRGFPGWHIECSAMAVKYLGERFDIHCGGKDHIPVHHCNEIAQAQVCYGTTLANFWVHGYFLEVDAGEDAAAKMSKSSGDFLRLDSLLERGYEAMSYRYLCLTAHYRSDLKFTWASLDSATTALGRLRAAAGLWREEVAGGADGEADAATVATFVHEIGRDLNTPHALAVLWRMVKGGLPSAVKLATLRRLDCLLGLQAHDWQPPAAAIPEEIQALAAARVRAREAKNWGEADRLRGLIEERGFVIDDSAGGSSVRKK